MLSWYVCTYFWYIHTLGTRLVTSATSDSNPMFVYCLPLLRFGTSVARACVYARPWEDREITWAQPVENRSKMLSNADEEALASLDVLLGRRSCDGGDKNLQARIRVSGPFPSVTLCSKLLVRCFYYYYLLLWLLRDECGRALPPSHPCCRLSSCFDWACTPEAHDTPKRSFSSVLILSITIIS